MVENGVGGFQRRRAPAQGGHFWTRPRLNFRPPSPRPRSRPSRIALSVLDCQGPKIQHSLIDAFSELGWLIAREMETTHLETLPFGPLTDRTVHLCIDMQNLFALDTPWHTPWMHRVLPVVARIAQRHPARTVLTRFIPPERPDQMPGSWRRYYERWRDLTQERMDPGLIELVPPLRAIAPPAEVIDKRVYSPFFRARSTGAAAPTRNRESRHHRCRNRCLRSGRSARRGRLRLPGCACDRCALQLVG